MPARLVAAEMDQAFVKELKALFAGLEKQDYNRFLRMQIPIAGMDLLQWLKNQTSEIKTYWRDREGRFEVAGVSAADSVSGALVPEYHALMNRLKTYLADADPRVRYYGGMRFNRKHASDYRWELFSSYHFTVPLFEVIRDGDKTFLACNVLVRDDQDKNKALLEILNAWSGISFQAAEHEALPAFIRRTDFPDKPRWHQNIHTALKAFSENKLEKIVLARRTCMEFEHPLNPVELLWRLKLNNHRAYYFGFQFNERTAFIGGTPEQLYRREGINIFTEAVAGTRRRGHNREEDLRLENDLLNSEKDVREHRFVVDSIGDTLNELCSRVSVEKNLSVLKLSSLQHLRKIFRGTLKDGQSDACILARLHPTPAVGGVPSAPAMEEIEKIEGFDRGWYAGPVGWISRNDAEFAVGIRSALVYENALYLYSGAGIVQGSHAENEWEEIENKIAGFMSAIEQIVPEHQPGKAHVF
ncbi:MAG TPA: isochorismate synthase [Caldithrix abyssi]|uniref:Isochorismate synthase MenF n=1 Tax=Caldithrix abyssi TaxID=187145 RepID=A0A7V1LMV2_CALAY|nr:isochorismate synthase [Caldithrix abyssi]